MWKRHASDAHLIFPREEFPRQAVLAGNVDLGERNHTDMGMLIRAKMVTDSLPLLRSLYPDEADYEWLQERAKAVNVIGSVVTGRVEEDEKIEEAAAQLERGIRHAQIPGEDQTLEEKLGSDATPLDMIRHISGKRMRDVAVCDAALTKLRDKFGGERVKLAASSENIVVLLEHLDKAILKLTPGTDVYQTMVDAFDAGNDLKDALPLTQHQEDRLADVLERATLRAKRGPVRSTAAARRAKTGGKQVWIESMAALVPSSSTQARIIRDLSTFAARPEFESLAPTSLAVAGKLQHVARLYDMAVSRARDTSSVSLTHDRKEVAKMLRVLHVALQQLIGVPKTSISGTTSAGKKLRVLFSTMLGIEYHTAYEYYNASEGRQKAEPTLYKSTDRLHVLDDKDWWDLSVMKPVPLKAMREAVEAAYAESWDASLP